MSEFNFDGLGIEELLQTASPEKRDWKAIETAKENGTNTESIKELTNKVEALDDSFFMLSMKVNEFMEQEPKIYSNQQARADQNWHPARKFRRLVNCVKNDINVLLVGSGKGRQQERTTLQKH
jgi:archaellum component FlaC